MERALKLVWPFSRTNVFSIRSAVICTSLTRFPLTWKAEDLNIVCETRYTLNSYSHA